MTKYASERIWRTPDGKLVAESAVKDGQAGGLGTSLAYATGDPIDGDDEDKVGKLASSKAPDAAPDAKGLTTAAGTSKGKGTSKPAVATTDDASDSADGSGDDSTDDTHDDSSGVTTPVVVDRVAATKPKKGA